VRRKLRLALLVTSAALSGLCGLLFVTSFVVSVGYVWVVRGDIPIWVASDSGSAMFMTDQFASLSTDSGPGWTCSRVDPAPAMTLLKLALMPEYHDWPAGTAAIIPLWIPMLAFGLWPFVVAVKAHRRRRRRARGFDVTPTG
jgi:hypothetical protein